MSRSVLVVGAGIVGASIAYHLARQGAAVTIVDSGEPGSGVTADSFAWIGSSGGSPGPAAALRATAGDEYRRLQSDLPDLPIRWDGALTWDTTRPAPVAGAGQRIIDPSATAELEPRVRRPPDWAVWAPDDGAADAVGVVRRLVAEAQSLGARVRLSEPVVSIRRDAQGAAVGVETAAGDLFAEIVVLAAGVASADLAAPLGAVIPVEASPSPLFRFDAPPDLVRRIVSTEHFDLRQTGPNRLIAAADHSGAALAAIRLTFDGADGVDLRGERIGARPMPRDGVPLIGPVPGVPELYAAVMHPAVTLAAAVGRLVARELVLGTDEALLGGCRLDRF